MKILESYLWKTLSISILLTWVSLVGLDTFFYYLRELNDTSPNTRYGSLQALLYIGYMLPRSLYDFFPTATLIGALMGLGQLAATSELIAMRAAGISIKNIMFSTLKLGVIMAIFIFAFGEWVAPKAEIMGKSFKIEKQQKGMAYTEAGAWNKEGNRHIHINKVWTKDKFSGVSTYQITSKNGAFEKLEIIEAETAERQGDSWLLHNVTIRSPQDDGIIVKHQDSLVINTLVSAKMLNATSVESKHLSAKELSTFIEHQDKNDLNTTRLEQAFWQRFSTPLATLVMLIIAMPFAFGSQRSAGAGQRLFLGILVGISFFLINQAMNNIGIVYGFSPILSAFMPLLMFLSFGLIMLKRIR